MYFDEKCILYIKGPFSEKWSYGAALFFSEFMPDVYFYDN